MYTAYDFWRDLLELFGDDAENIAARYLDVVNAQGKANEKSPGEIAFCKDLHSIISTR